MAAFEYRFRIETRRRRDATIAITLRSVSRWE
jgi:hypothetical protein